MVLLLLIIDIANSEVCTDTGQSLIELLQNNTHMDLRHVSSRELKGQKLKGYDKREIIYESLTHEDVRRMTDIDCWIMALPNGVSKPWVDNIQDNGNENAIIVDLSADYRFDPEWTYGLPELIDRSTICKAKRISNPGCYGRLFHRSNRFSFPLIVSSHRSPDRHRASPLIPESQCQPDRGWSFRILWCRNVSTLGITVADTC